MAEKKLRMTRQRNIILDELRKAHKHPSASDVYEKVRKSLPHVSLGTVYRNLEMLSSKGVIKRLDMPSGQRRYEAAMHEHQHILCVSCGRMDDVFQDMQKSLHDVLANVGNDSGYSRIGCSVAFYGLCPECSGEELKKTKKTTGK